MSDLYFCPTAGEVESARHGGFDVCCAAPELHRPPTAPELAGVIGEPSRLFFSRSWDGPWWRPLILVGIRGGDEWCNRTVGLRLPGGALFLCLDVPLRRVPCDECIGGPS
jgi:hypothetical protein